MINFKKTYPTPLEHSKWVNKCKYIILHHTWTPEWTIKWVLDWLYRRWDLASCHIAIDTNWDVYKIGKTTDILWHCGKSSWGNDVIGNSLNAYSIWIELLWPTLH